MPDRRRSRSVQIATIVRRLPRTSVWLLVVGLSLTGIVLPIAVTVSGALYSVFSGIAGTLFDVSSVLDRERGRYRTEADRQSRGQQALLKENLQLKKVNDLRDGQVDVLSRKVVTAETELRRMRVELDRASRTPLLDRQVNYRGKTERLGDAMLDTSSRLRTRAYSMSARNIASIAGESVPLWGPVVVIAATTWELADTCAMMRDLDELDSAILGAPVDGPDAVCGLEVPSVEDARNSLENGLDSVIADVGTLYGGLPDFQWTAGWSSVWQDAGRISETPE